MKTLREEYNDYQNQVKNEAKKLKQLGPKLVGGTA